MLVAAAVSVGLADRDGVCANPAVPEFPAEPDSGEEDTGTDAEAPDRPRRGALPSDADEPDPPPTAGIAGAESSRLPAADSPEVDDESPRLATGVPGPSGCDDTTSLPPEVRVARPELRDGEVLISLDDGADDVSALEPAEPVVSASARGIAERPDPTPRATASAPTRPT